jgi:Na+/alanine symporter
MRMLTKLVAIILLLISTILSAYYQVAHGFSYLQSASIVLMLVVIVLLVVEKQA